MYGQRVQQLIGDQHAFEDLWEIGGRLDESVRHFSKHATLRRARGRTGLDQTYFLMGLAADLESADLKTRLALKTLMLPGGLGSSHKVLILGKDVGSPSLAGCSYRVRVT